MRTCLPHWYHFLFKQLLLYSNAAAWLAPKAPSTAEATAISSLSMKLSLSLVVLFIVLLLSFGFHSLRRLKAPFSRHVSS